MRGPATGCPSRKTGTPFNTVRAMRAAKLRALERRPAALVAHLRRVDARHGGQVDGHEVGVVALADEAALGDAEQHRRIVRGLLDDLRQREQPLRVLIEQHQQRVLHERQARRRLEVAARLLLERVRRVVRRDDVDAIVDDGRSQRVTVGGRLDRGVALDLRAERRVARLVEPQDDACRPRP